MSVTVAVPAPASLRAHYIVAYEHQSLLVEPNGPVPPAAMRAFQQAIPRLPPGALTPILGGIKTGHYCGLLSNAGWTLEILPKTHRKTKSTPQRQLLTRMLAESYSVPIWQGNDSTAGVADDLLTVIIRCFLNEALKQLRPGPLRRYRLQQEALLQPRGRLDIPQQLRKGVANVTPLHCEFDELTIDNTHNQAVLAALDAVKQRLVAISPEQHSANELSAILQTVSACHVTAANVRDITLNRLSQHYSRLLKLAEWLLQLLGPNVHIGEQQGISLLFNMNLLFESYVGVHLRRALLASKWRSEFTLRQEQPRRFLATTENGKGMFQLRPDYCLCRENMVIAIFDTKWKRLFNVGFDSDPGSDPGSNEYAAHSRNNVSQADVYQMLGYAHSYQCKKLALVYPTQNYPTQSNFGATAENTNPANFEFQHDAGQLALQTFNLEQPHRSARSLIEQTCEASA